MSDPQKLGDGPDRVEISEPISDRPARSVVGNLGAGGKVALGAVVVAGTFTLGLLTGSGFSVDVGAQTSLTGRAEFATLEETWDLIHEQWPDPESIDDAALIYGAAQGMVDAMGDVGHSAFLDPAATAEFEESREGRYVGIGVEVDARCGVPVVASIFSGSPAEVAGLRPGDVIAAVDDESTQGVDMRELRDLILGNEGDALTLTVERMSEPEPLLIDVVRRTIQVEPVTWRWLPQETVHMRVTGFEPGVNLKVRDALETIRAEDAQRLILDLRGNPGGLVPEVIGVASQFLPEGTTIFQEQERDEPARPITTVGKTGMWLELALVVLIDDASASGAEVLAAALREHGRAQLIGETTFGTGTVLSTFPNDDGSSVVLATAFWLTPEGDHVWQEGVEPDRFVTLDRDAFPSRPEDDSELTAIELEDSADAQLQAAFEALDSELVAQD